MLNMNNSQKILSEALSSASGLRSQPQPLRLSLHCLFLGSWIITVILAWTIYSSRSHFPPWFCPIALAGLAFLLATITSYSWTIHRVHMPLHPPGTPEAVLLWALVILSVICTSSMHGFAPFHPHILAEYSQLPSSLRFIGYNFILTGCSLLAVVTFRVFYFRGQQQLALTALVVLAGVMLIPNDDCPNDFNLPWIGWLGASPLMFLFNAVVLLIGYCGLSGLRPRVSAVLMGLINGGVLFVGLGHQTGLIW